MKIFDCIQGSEEWHALRCGVPTASNFDKIVTPQGAASKQRDKYLWRLAGEGITGSQENGYKSAAMEGGKDREEEARETYELITDTGVDQVGFCMPEAGLRCGASPDGLVGKDGEIEIKCPLIATHVSYLIKNTLPSEYIPQVQGQLFVTGRKWCDFIGYYLGIKPLIIRIERDETFLAALDFELKLFVKVLEIITNKIRG